MPELAENILKGLIQTKKFMPTLERFDKDVL